MDAYTIGLVIIVGYIINKMVELSLTAISVVVVAAGVIAAIGGKKK